MYGSPRLATPVLSRPVFSYSTTGRQEVVVVFHQSLFIGGKTKNRIVGWNLCHAPLELAVGQDGLRQLTNTCDRVQLMPVFSQGKVPADATSASPGYAVLDWSWSRFSVHLAGVPSGPFSLPASRHERRTFWRIAGMPFAIATDAAIVGAAIMSAGGGMSTRP